MSNTKRVNKNSSLSDPVAERIVIASILQHGHEVFFDISTQISSDTFAQMQNHIIYSVAENLINAGTQKPDIVTILAKINQIDGSAISKYSLDEYLSALMVDPISKDNIPQFVRRIRSLSFARSLRGKLQESIRTLEDITGEENILQILSIAESPLNTLVVDLVNGTDTVNLSDVLIDYLNFVAEQQPKIQGIPTGFPIYDHMIGGGLRNPGVHIIAARAKMGKSFMLLNIAFNVMKLGIPVLYLDTELTQELMLGRYAARVTETPIDIIETGKFADNINTSTRVKQTAESAANYPFYYHNISGKSHQEWLSLMRRFLMKTVGFEDGKLKPCLIVLDYVKLMNLDDAGSFAEHQYLGQIMTDLHNFAVQYNIPILTAAQVNRDGISKEDQSIVADSDKMVRYCSSLTIMKNKSSDDFTADPQTNGDKKLIVVASRFGRGTSDGEYVNVISDLSRGLIKEGKTNIENRQGSKLVKNAIDVKNKANAPDPFKNASSDLGTEIDF